MQKFIQKLGDNKMGLTSEMQNLSEEILASFKQRIKETEERAKSNVELVNEVQKTLDGFRKNHQEMAAILNSNATALRKGLAKGEEDRLSTFKGLMDGIHSTISTIQKEVLLIQTSTFGLLNEFNENRAKMAVELDKFFAKGRNDREQNEKIRMQDEKTRIEEFDSLMKNIHADLKSINDEVFSILKNTNDMLEKFEKEHLEMSVELRGDLSKNLAERLEYTKSLLLGFQNRLAEIGRENNQMADQMRKDLATSQKDLAKSEAERVKDYKSVMNGIHTAIQGIRKEVRDTQKATAGMLGDLSQDRSQASAEWKKMQDTIAQLRKKGIDTSPKEVVKKEAKKEAPVEGVKKVEKIDSKKETPVEKVMEVPVKAEPKEKVMETPAVKVKPEPVAPTTLEEKILDFINKHPKGVKISEMEKPLGETRMKLGFIAKNLLNSGKVQKIDNIYFPLK